MNYIVHDFENKRHYLLQQNAFQQLLKNRKREATKSIRHGQADYILYGVLMISDGKIFGVQLFYAEWSEAVFIQQEQSLAALHPQWKLLTVSSPRAGVIQWSKL